MKAVAQRQARDSLHPGVSALICDRGRSPAKRLVGPGFRKFMLQCLENLFSLRIVMDTIFEVGLSEHCAYAASCPWTHAQKRRIQIAEGSEAVEGRVYPVIDWNVDVLRNGMRRQDRLLCDGTRRPATDEERQ